MPESRRAEIPAQCAVSKDPTGSYSPGAGKLKAERGKKIEPWYIATDLNRAYELYRKRFWIEEMFRDFKSRFHWCGYKVETEQRREMLTFCLMVYSGVAWLPDGKDQQSIPGIQLW